MDIICDPISPSDFYHDYMVKNRPCLIQNKMIHSWKSVKDWCTKDGGINFKFLSDNFGHLNVPVSNCKQKYYNSQVTQDMNFGEYLKYWEDVIGSSHDYTNNECLYLKDWHFCLEVPKYEAYETPEIFLSDWLNEHCLSRSESDYRFVYMGPKGSSTPLHKDVFSSFSWSANVVGQKEWILIPPGRESQLLSVDGQLPFDVKPKLNSPGFRETMEVIEVTQDAGQVIFVPSGWIHQVLNTQDTISINHNWFNACNILFIWESLEQALIQIQKELQDLKPKEQKSKEQKSEEQKSEEEQLDLSSWDEECQHLLRLHHGMNYSDFCDILRTVSGRLEQEINDTDPSEWYRIEHELNSIEKVVEENEICEELKNQINYLLSKFSSLS